LISAGDQATASETTAYDPGAHTVARVLEYAAAHPDERNQIVAAEKAGKNRTTLLNQLG
jgi:hypothetical protein